MRTSTDRRKTSPVNASITNAPMIPSSQAAADTPCSRLRTSVDSATNPSG